MVTIHRRTASLTTGFRGFWRGYEGPRQRSLVMTVMGLLIRWQERAEQRYALAELDDRLLRDVGIDRIAARQESRKHFWQA